MPVYDYFRYRCGSSFEQPRRMKDDDREGRCPDCGSDRIERLLSTFATAGYRSSGLSQFSLRIVNRGQLGRKKL